MGLGSNLRGHEGYGSDVVSHGTRLELAPYIELNFYYTDKINDEPSRRWRIVLVPAFAGGNLFHYSGDLVNHITVRNAYAEVENLGAKGLTFWNEFILAATLMNEPTSFTLPVQWQRYVGDFSTEWGRFAAGAILVSLPVLALFLSLERHVTGGLTQGGVKE